MYKKFSMSMYFFSTEKRVYTSHGCMRTDAYAFSIIFKSSNYSHNFSFYISLIQNDLKQKRHPHFGSR